MTWQGTLTICLKILKHLWYEQRKRNLFLIPFILTLRTFSGSVHIQNSTLVCGQQSGIHRDINESINASDLDQFRSPRTRTQTNATITARMPPTKSVSCIILRHKCAWQKHTLHICCTLEKGDKLTVSKRYQQNVQNKQSLRLTGYSAGVRGHWLCFCPESFSVCRRECRPGPYTLPPRHTHSV